MFKVNMFKYQLYIFNYCFTKITTPSKMATTGDAIQAIAAYLGVKCGKITYDGVEKVIVYLF